MESDVEAIVAKLTKAQRSTVVHLDTGWCAGPDLPSTITKELAVLREVGIVEREFADMHDPAYAKSAAAIAIRLSACWWFHLTPLGLAVRTALLSQAKE